jgi:hypothetical protein
MRWRKKWGLCLLACFFLPGCSRCQTGDDVARCQSTDPDIRISGCTALINSNTLTGATLAGTFNNRGTVYSEKDQYNRVP